MELDKIFSVNKEAWNNKTPFHLKSEMYDVEGFKQGRTSLQFIELEELGEVNGKSMLHLQCHFGLDSLSWARKGAKVTGVDFSGEAIKAAKRLNEELNLKANFIESNIYDLKDKLNGCPI